MQRLFGAHDVVFDSVFDEQLQAAGYDIAPKQGPGNVDLDLESLGEPFLQEVDILAGEFEFLLQGYQLFVGFFEHVAVCRGEFADERAGPLGLVFLNEVIEDVERIEQEVGVDLLFEPVVVEQRAVFLAAFRAEFAVALDDVDRELEHGVDDDVDEQHDGIEPEEVAGRQGGAVALRQAEVDGGRE